MEKKNEVLRKRILPVLLYCQANKGDLELYDEWAKHKGANKKLFYAYYSGIFCRILFLLESERLHSQFIKDCNHLLDKYNWFDVQDKDIELCCSTIDNGCEVPYAIEEISAVDKDIWNYHSFVNDAFCWEVGGRSWTFADVRGNMRVSEEN